VLLHCSVRRRIGYRGRVHARVDGQHWALEECLPQAPDLIEANSGQGAASSCASMVLRTTRVVVAAAQPDCLDGVH
jgi:hypothetical protein